MPGWPPGGRGGRAAGRRGGDRAGGAARGVGGGRAAWTRRRCWRWWSARRRRISWPRGRTATGIRFTHALIREALYEDVPALRRRRLHRQVGEALAALPAPDPDAVAYHFQQAGDARAAAWLVRAGERAEDAYALVTAAERYEAAFTLLDAQDGDAAERGWLRLLAAALRRHEDLDQALAWVEEAVRLAATAGDPSLAARAQALLGFSSAIAATSAPRLRPRPRPRHDRPTAAGERHHPPPRAADRQGRQPRHADRRSRLRRTPCRGPQAGRTLSRTSADAATTPGGLGAIADAHHGLALAYALQGEPGWRGGPTPPRSRPMRRATSRVRTRQPARGTDPRGAAVSGGRSGGAGARRRGGGADGGG